MNLSKGYTGAIVSYSYNFSVFLNYLFEMLFKYEIKNIKNNWMNSVVRILGARTILPNIFIYSSIYFQVFVELALSLGSGDAVVQRKNMVIVLWEIAY